MQLVTLQVFNSAVDAHILRSKLESEGITSFIHDEHTVGLNPLWNVTVGGVKLQVNEDDYEKAKSILNEVQKSEYLDENGEPICCPKCNSANIIGQYTTMIKSVKGIFSFLLSLLLFTYPLYVETIFKCGNCKHEFKRKTKKTN